jgi:hypothetical protein
MESTDALMPALGALGCSVRVQLATVLLELQSQGLFGDLSGILNVVASSISANMLWHSVVEKLGTRLPGHASLGGVCTLLKNVFAVDSPASATSPGDAPDNICMNGCLGSSLPSLLLPPSALPAEKTDMGSGLSMAVLGMSAYSGGHVWLPLHVAMAGETAAPSIARAVLDFAHRRPTDVPALAAQLARAPACIRAAVADRLCAAMMQTQQPRAWAGLAATTLPAVAAVDGPSASAWARLASITAAHRQGREPTVSATALVGLLAYLTALVSGQLRTASSLDNPGFVLVVLLMMVCFVVSWYR